MNHLAESHLRLIDELDARQDEAIAQIDELNARLERLLAEFSSKRDDDRQEQRSPGGAPSLAEAA